MRDVGQLAVPVELLVKTGRLTPPERALVEIHAEAGYDILKDAKRDNETQHSAMLASRRR